MAKRSDMKSKAGPRHGGVTISSKGQVTIPKDVRVALGLKPMDRVTFEVRNGQALVKRAPNFLNRFGSVKPRRRPEDFRKVRAEVSRRIGSQVAGEGR